MREAVKYVEKMAVEGLWEDLKGVRKLRTMGWKKSGEPERLLFCLGCGSDLVWNGWTYHITPEDLAEIEKCNRFYKEKWKDLAA